MVLDVDRWIFCVPASIRGPNPRCPSPAFGGRSTDLAVREKRYISNRTVGSWLVAFRLDA